MDNTDDNILPKVEWNDEYKKIDEEIPITNEQRREAAFEKWKPLRTRSLILLGMVGLLPSFTSTMYLPNIKEIENQLNTSEEIVALSVSLYLLTIGGFPLFFGPVGDRIGRQRTLVLTLPLYCISSFLCGFAWDIYFLLLFRTMQGMFLAPATVSAFGTISDMYPPHIRANAVGWFAVTALIGPNIGPILGGIIGQYLGWRAIFYILGGVGCIISILIFFFLPETLDKNGPKKSFNIFSALKYYIYPNIGPVAMQSGAIFGGMYSMIIFFSFEASNSYNLDELTTGMAFVSLGLGTICGSVIGGRVADACLRWFGSGGRLIPAALGGIITSLLLLVVGWVMTASLPGIILLMFLVGLSLTITRPGAAAFTIERVPHAASGVSSVLLSAMQSTAFVLVSVGPSWVNATSYPLVFTVLSSWILFWTLVVIIIMYKYWGSKDT